MKETTDKTKGIIITILQLFIIGSLVIFVANAQYDNGKIDMCKELGGNLTTDQECIGASTVDKLLNQQKYIPETVFEFPETK